jgi:hypothetical protein
MTEFIKKEQLAALPTFEEIICGCRRARVVAMVFQLREAQFADGFFGLFGKDRILHTIRESLQAQRVSDVGIADSEKIEAGIYQL